MCRKTVFCLLMVALVFVVYGVAGATGGDPVIPIGTYQWNDTVTDQGTDTWDDATIPASPFAKNELHFGAVAWCFDNTHEETALIGTFSSELYIPGVVNYVMDDISFSGDWLSPDQDYYDIAIPSGGYMRTKCSTDDTSAGLIQSRVTGWAYGTSNIKPED